MSPDRKRKKDDSRFIPKKPGLTEPDAPPEPIEPEPDPEILPEDEELESPPPDEPPAPGEGP